ncbi:carbamoyltransferase family protein [Paractinoplanes brasiliensis]|uniref:Carbamoyltransferase n=1 Tax=Paractinoplanes brasiliensis TaxID=52695 RepID=A0A4R6JKJ4_9ACTN|nr:carbamoyltransferase C-terminal domain-containing protein [Actinoplanes brasiliensis]TDO36764.1 carbamoyltransferase [Actinoplanes brasiliensis]GID33459.1 carbamoyltransferase [Actinoplanes brasiliensis]
MLVLGISGLDRAAALKKRMMPGLDPREQRLVQGLDSAAALVDENGVIAASAQERHDGVKGTGAFPADAVAACLRMAGATLSDVDLVAHGFRYQPSAAFELDDYLRRWYREAYSEGVQLDVLRSHYPDQDWERKLVRVPHHLAHAASTYHLSGFADALVLVADGMGETESTSLFSGHDGRLETLRTYPIGSSLGILYSVVTQYLGFLPGMDEYKVMGLAPYGDIGSFPDAGLVTLRPDGGLSVPLLACDKTPEERETHRGAIRRLEELFGPARHPDAPITQRHMDIAAVLQRSLEQSLLYVLDGAPGKAYRDLCMAGGVALNCTANGLIARSGRFDRMFVQPASGDDGTALGAALHVLRSHVPAVPAAMGMPYWGEEFGATEIEAALATLGPGHRVRHLPGEALLAETSDLIAAGKVVAWFQGRMEFGPRALGNRSILADPTAPDMRAHLNAVVKQREEFRPFAPAVVAEEAGEYFEIEPGEEGLYRHMLVVARVRDKYRDELPSITHVDGSARVQVVDRELAPRFHALIRRFGDDHRTPVVLNTSFNLRGQPIVRTPQEAVATYARSALDALAIGDWLVGREPAGGSDE